MSTTPSNVTGGETKNESVEIPVIIAYINATISLILVIIVLFGNCSIIIIYIKFKKIRDLNNTAVTFLSACDLLRGSIVMLIKIYNQFLLATELIEPFCTLTALTSAFTFVFNPQLLALIAVIRYRKIALRSDIKLQVSRRNFNISISVLFTVSLIFAFLPIMGVGVYDYSLSHGVCFTDWSERNRIFRSMFYVIVIGIAFPVLTVFYSMLFNVLRKHKLKMLSNYNPSNEEDDKNKKIMFLRKTSRDDHCIKRETNAEINQNNDIREDGNALTNVQKHGRNVLEIATIQTDENVLDVLQTKGAETAEIQEDAEQQAEDTEDVITSDNSSIEHSNYDDKRMEKQKKTIAKHLSKQEYQVTKLMIMIFIAYCVCWIPAAIVNFIALVDPSNVPVVWLYVIVTMVEMKSALNPMIYGLGNRKYRAAFKTLIQKYCRVDI